MRTLKLPALACLAAAFCQCQQRETSTVSVSLAGLYEQQGLSLVSKTKVEVSKLRYVLLGPQGPLGSDGKTLILSSADVTPDATSLSFVIDAPAGRGRMLGLLGGTERNGQTALSYMGLAGPIDLAPQEERTVTVVFHPAGLVETKLVLDEVDRRRLETSGFDGPSGCELLLERTTPLADAPPSHTFFAPFDGVPSPPLPDDDPGSIFGPGRMGVPAGDYLASCRVGERLTQPLVLFEKIAVRVLQAERAVITLQVDLPDPALPGISGPTGPSGPKIEPLLFEVATSDDPAIFTAEPNIVSGQTALRKSSVGIQAKRTDGTLATDFAGDVLVRFYRVEINTQTRALAVNRQRTTPWPVRPNAAAVASPTNEYRLTMGALGRLNVPIVSSDDFLGVVEVVALDDAGLPNPHSSGAALFHVSPAPPRCIPVAVDAAALPETGANVLPLVYTENGGLSVATNAGAVTALDSHALFGFIAPEATGSRACVLPGFLNLPAANADYPGMTLSAPLVAAMQPFFVINSGGLEFRPLSMPGASPFTANVPLRFFPTGQRFVPNALRANTALGQTGMSLTVQASLLSAPGGPAAGTPSSLTWSIQPVP